MDTVVLSPPHHSPPFELRKNLLKSLMEVEQNCESGKPVNEDEEFKPPPRKILQYLVRMGSFTSVPALREDSQDVDFEVPQHATRDSLIHRCRSELPLVAQPIVRNFVTINNKLTNSGNTGKGRRNSVPVWNEEEYGNQKLVPPGLARLSFLSGGSHSASEAEEAEGSFRILTWNILAQALAVSHDNFVGLPDGTLNWNLRRLHILHEIISYDPDIICLQEVDHFNFLRSSLKPLGYSGVFCSKPDSPCIYLAENNGPDGCALFFRQNKFDLISATSRIIEIWKIKSNQVCILANLRLRETGQQVSIATTHLKARHGGFLAQMRNEQGKDLVDFFKSCGVTSKPLILCGDFNAIPTEPVVATLKKRLSVKSAYSNLYNGDEPPFTTWKVRGDGEYCHTLDYIFHNKYFTVDKVLSLPTADQVGPTRLPNLSYASDHISIACDVRITS